MNIRHLWAAFVLFLALSGTSHAQATRTWVSGVGDDANPCSRTAPCKTFAAAISKTATAGEINCIDGGGFGALTISKSISIICSSTEAGVLVSGTDGIQINAGPNDVVHLSGLDIEGLGTGLSGVDIIQAGEVHIDNSTIQGFTVAGIYVEPSGTSVTVDVTNSIISGNSGSGIRNKPSGGTSVMMTIDHAIVSKNGGDGIMANGTLTTGSVNVAVRDGVAAFNNGCGFIAYSNGANATVLLDGGIVQGNGTGILASGSGATVYFERSIINGNTTGVSQTSPGTALSYGSNSIVGNHSNGSFGTAPPLQ